MPPQKKPPVCSSLAVESDFDVRAPHGECLWSKSTEAISSMGAQVLRSLELKTKLGMREVAGAESLLCK